MLLVATVVLAALPAVAEDTREKDELDVEVIEIRAPRKPEVSDLPSALVTVVETEDLGPGMVTTSMLARSAPATRIRELGGPGQLVTMGLRGAASHQILVQIDGVPIPDPTGMGVDLSALPADFIERMEVLRGAASIQAGSGALGGVVNLVTRSERAGGYFGRLSAGSYGTWKGSVGTAFEAGKSRFLLVASGLSTAGDFPFPWNNGTPYNPYDDRLGIRRNNDVLRGGWLLKSSTRLGGGLDIHLTHQMVALERGAAGLLGFTAEAARDSAWSGLIDLRGRVPLGNASLEAGINLLMDGRHFRDPLGELTGVSIDSRQEGKFLEAFTAGLFPLGETHLIRSRLSLRSCGIRAAAFGDPERTELDASVGAELAFFSDRLKILPGIWGGYFTDAGLQWAPAVGALVSAADSIFIRANLARAFRVPNFNELFQNAGYAVGNTDLDPEYVWTADLGVECTRWQGWRLTLAGFYSHYRDLIVFELISNFRYMPMNVGAAEIYGLEFEIGGQPIEGLEIFGHYTLLLTADRSGQPNREGNDLPGRPRHTAGLRLNGHWGRLLTEADVYLVSSNFVNQANTRDKQLAARLLLGAGVGVDAGGGMTVMLQVKNMLNDQVHDVRGLPLPGISFFLTVGITRKEKS
jgi:iron complex outermembrane receptor protein